MDRAGYRKKGRSMEGLRDPLPDECPVPYIRGEMYCVQSPVSSCGRRKLLPEKRDQGCSLLFKDDRQWEG